MYADNSAPTAPRPAVTVPRLRERAFVLVPLAEIAPSLQIIGQGKVSDLLAQVDASGVEATE